MADNMHAAQSVSDTLRAHGGRVVLSPGGRSGTLALPLLRDCDARMVLDERAAAFVALGWARVVGAPVALLCTSGSAGAHYLPALIEAWHSRVPLVVITADRPADLRGRGAPQTTRQSFFGDFVVERIDPGLPEDGHWQAATKRAFERAQQTSRPVHLNLPLREPLWSASGVFAPADVAVNQPSIERIAARLPRRLLAAERGIIHCGSQAGDDPELPALIAALGATLGWPIIAEAASGARIDGAGGAADLLDAATLMGPPEVVLRFGRCPLHRATREWLATATHTVLVDPFGDLHHPEAGPFTLLSGHAGATIRAHLGGTRTSMWLQKWDMALLKRAVWANTAVNTGWWEGRIAHMVMAAARTAGARIHVSNSMPIRDLDIFGAASGTIHVNRGINGIDGTVATATGEALAGDGPVWLLTGDLSLLHDASSLSLARQLGVADRLRVIVVDNSGGGIFHQLPFAKAPLFEQAFITDQALDCGAIARARGLSVARVEHADAFAIALEGPAQFIHVRVDRATSVAARRAARGPEID